MAAEDERKLFVAGLPDSITEDVLRQLFEATGGTVLNVSLPRDRATGRPRGFGFVTLSSAEEAEGARSALDGSMQAGRSMSVRPFQSEAPRRGDPRDVGIRSERPERSDRGDRSPRDDRGDRTLYVGNLPYDCTVQEVEDLFREQEAGPVARVHLPQGPDGRPRGFGFVTMPSPEAANQAIEALRDADVRGRRLIVNVAHPRGERPERVASDPRGGGADLRGPAGGDRPDRSPRPPREPSVRPSYPDPMDQSPPFLDSPKSEGRRRGERPEKKPKKRKKGTGGERSVAAPPKRGRDRMRDWEDWDDD